MGHSWHGQVKPMEGVANDDQWSGRGIPCNYASVNRLLPDPLSRWAGRRKRSIPLTARIKFELILMISRVMAYAEAAGGCRPSGACPSAASAPGCDSERSTENPRGSARSFTDPTRIPESPAKPSGIHGTRTEFWCPTALGHGPAQAVGPFRRSLELRRSAAPSPGTSSRPCATGPGRGRCGRPG